MPVLPPGPITATSWTVAKKSLELITSALRTLNVCSATETPSAPQGTLGLEYLQRLIDQWNAREELIYNVSFDEYTLIANHQPHTIGPGGDFDVPLRPVKLVKCALVLTTGAAIPIDILQYQADDAWWAANAIKGLTSTLPAAVYYSPDIPLGQLFFWPIPTEVNDIRLETWKNLTMPVDLSTSLVMPQGYWDAIVYTLAIKLAIPYGRPVSPDLRQAHSEAMHAIMGNDNPAPRISLNGGGIADARDSAQVIPDWNFLTGQRGPQGR